MKLFYIIFLFLVSMAAKSQAVEQLSIGKVDKIYSRILTEERQIWIYNPSNGNAAERFPVLYLLDAENYFFSTVGMIRQMTGRWPGMIVVGITNTNRNRDLIPTVDSVGLSGGGSQFLRFIKDELIPHIDSLYPAAPYRLFSGHSLGGLTVINTLLTDPGLFNAYIAIDPSLWWNNESIVNESAKYFQTNRFNNIKLFVGRAKNMPFAMDTSAAMQDTSSFTMLYRAVSKFVKTLRKSSNTKLSWDTRFYPEESHGTVEFIGQYDALKFIFGYYQFRTSQLELNPNLNMDSVLAAHFKNISTELGYLVVPPESLVNNLGYTCMQLKKWEKAEIFFKMNVDNYPSDPNVYDSMGDFYSATADIFKAVRNYRKALTLGNDAETKRKLESLTGNK